MRLVSTVLTLLFLVPTHAGEPVKYPPPAQVKADFLKLRDVSASYDLPVARAKRFVDRATVTVAGHNLKVWTKYGGADPEVNFNGVSTFNRNDSWTVPMTRRYSASLSVNF